MSGQIDVSVNASPTVDLNAIMADVREEYENVARKNQRDLEDWFQKKVRAGRLVVYND